MAEDIKEEKKGTHKQNKPQRLKHEYEDYTFFLHKKKVELHIAYGNTVLQLTGILRAKAKYDLQLIMEDDKGGKKILTINKAYVIMVKPV